MPVADAPATPTGATPPAATPPAATPPATTPPAATPDAASPGSAAPSPTRSAPSSTLARPRLRGVLHEIAFFISLVTGPALVVAAPGGGPRLAIAVYAISVSALFGVSALLHRRTWTPEARRVMRRLDHSMIFFLIAGTYTAVVPLALHGATADVILAVVWVGGTLGMIVELFWLDAPKWAVALPYVVVGWSAVGAIPQLASRIGGAGLALLVGGGLAYTLGALVYALRRPNPWPSTFGYHEVFHGLTVVAAAAHYLLIARYVLPLA